MKQVTLRNGVVVDQMALGTFRSEPEAAYNAVKTALEAGYRHIDTAAVYGNEKAVGDAIHDSEIPRANIFITTKLWNEDQGYESTKKAFEKSLNNLGTDYIDLYLIHWPGDMVQVAESWRAMEDLYLEGKIRAIGVSNFNIHHLMTLFLNCRIIPMVNQVECHVQLQQTVLQDFCMKFEIFLEAYAPLMSHEITTMLELPEMKELAEKHQVNIPQIAIAWLMHRDIIALPKSITPKRIIENFNALDITLDKDDIYVLSKLQRGNRIFAEPDNRWF